MTSPTANQTSARLEATFGLGRDWTSQAGQSATVWETPAYHLLWFNDAASDVELRRLWEARKGRQAYPVVLLAPSDDVNKLRVAGPQDARPIRELPVSRVLDLLETSRSLAAREAASFLAREFSRLEEAVVPGLRVKDLLTPHFMRERLRRPINEQRLSSAVQGIASTSSIAWRSLFQGMGYQVEQLPQRGYLLRHDNAPVAVVHPHRDTSQFSRLTDNGELPEGMVLADCAQHGAHWGVLTAEGRYRLFQRRPPVGPATGQHVEIDLGELERKDRLYLGLLAPESLKENGWLTEWVGEAKDFGEELRKGLEERLIKDALPNIARGLGEYLESQGADMRDREQLRQIEEACADPGVPVHVPVAHRGSRLSPHRLGGLPAPQCPPACRGLPAGAVVAQPEGHPAVGPTSDTGADGAHRRPLGRSAGLQRQPLRCRWLPWQRIAGTGRNRRCLPRSCARGHRLRDGQARRSWTGLCRPADRPPGSHL